MSTYVPGIGFPAFHRHRKAGRIACVSYKQRRIRFPDSAALRPK